MEDLQRFLNGEPVLAKAGQSVAQGLALVCAAGRGCW